MHIVSTSSFHGNYLEMFAVGIKVAVKEVLPRTECPNTLYVYGYMTYAAFAMS